MKWELPPIIKIYEAVGAIADGRVEVIGHNGKVYSSNKNKYYEISYDPDAKAIMANDNGSFWKGYLGYPAISFLMVLGKLSYSKDIGEMLKGIQWKEINTKFKNDFDKTLEHILSSKTEDEKEMINQLVRKVYEEIKELNLSLLGKKRKPPKGF